MFIVLCSDNTYYTGITRDLNKTLIGINVLKTELYFYKHPERTPVTVVFKEDGVPFKEAYAKLRYLREMNRKLKDKLIKTKKWPNGGPLKQYLDNKIE